jgi:CheY-like chemotaxis protein
MVVLLDVRMPRISGAEVVERVAEQIVLARHAYILVTAQFGQTMSLRFAELVTQLGIPSSPSRSTSPGCWRQSNRLHAVFPEAARARGPSSTSTYLGRPQRSSPTSRRPQGAFYAGGRA